MNAYISSLFPFYSKNHPKKIGRQSLIREENPCSSELINTTIKPENSLCVWTLQDAVLFGALPLLVRWEKIGVLVGKKHDDAICLSTHQLVVKPQYTTSVTYLSVSQSSIYMI